MDAAQSVCVLGHEVALKLFSAEDPLGRDVRVGLDYFRVIGVMEPRARAAASEASLDAPSANAALGWIFIPLETARRRYGEVLSRRRGGTFEAEKVALHEITVRVALGIAIPFAVAALAHMKVIVTLWSPIEAFTLSAIVGILFGIYPVQRAAALDPVEALRHE